MKNLALIILNYNSLNDTIKCVENLLNFGKDYKIIVVDNMSTDNSYKEIRDKFNEHKCIDIIQTDYNGGYSAGNNYGIKYSIEKYNVDYVAIINPDVIIPSINVLERLMNAIESNSEVGVIGAICINAKGEYNPNFSYWSIPTTKELVLNHFLHNKRKTRVKSNKIIMDGIIQVDCVAGCFFIAKVSILEKINFLDENVFLYNEENILGIRLKRLGYIEAVVLDQFYIHNHKQDKVKDTNLSRKINATRNGYISRKYLCKEYYSPIFVPMLWIVEMLNRLSLLMGYIKNVCTKCISNIL